jgi:hypothetical protein
LYQHIEISDENLSLYGNDGDDKVLPGVAARIIVNPHDNADALFESEAASFEPHPAAQDNTPIPHSIPRTRDEVFIEHTSIYDANSSAITTQDAIASGLRNFSFAADKPDLIIPHGREAISEYDNPKLFPGMFPTLFPYGLGGFDDHMRDIPISKAVHESFGGSAKFDKD